MCGNEDNHFCAYLKLYSDIMSCIRKLDSDICADIVFIQRSERDFDSIF